MLGLNNEFCASGLLLIYHHYLFLNDIQNSRRDDCFILKNFKPYSSFVCFYNMSQNSLTVEVFVARSVFVGIMSCHLLHFKRKGAVWDQVQRQQILEFDYFRFLNQEFSCFYLFEISLNYESLKFVLDSGSRRILIY